MQLNIIGDIFGNIAGFFTGSVGSAAQTVSEFAENVGKFLDKIKSAVVDIFDMFTIFVDFIPSPFKEILTGSVVILSIVIIYKMIRG